MEDTASKLEDFVSRREFTKKSALALLSGVAITIVGCSSDTPTSPTPPPVAPPPAPPATTPSSDVSGQVSANHGHTAVITGAALTAGGLLSLDITGTADHPHTVELSDADLTQIQNGQRVSKTSSNNSSHSHTVTFN